MSEDIASAAARTKIFARIRAALGVDPEDPSGQAVVADRLRRHPSGTVPASARLYGEQAIGQFSTSIAKQGADVSRAATPKQVMARDRLVSRRQQFAAALAHGDRQGTRSAALA